MGSLTTSPERPRTADDLLERLLGLHRQEELLYTRVLALAAQQYEITDKGTAMGEIRRILARKQACLEEIGRLEEQESAARSAWEQEQGTWSPQEQAALLAGRARISALIDEILACEERNGQALLVKATDV